MKLGLFSILMRCNLFVEEGYVSITKALTNSLLSFALVLALVLSSSFYRISNSTYCMHPHK